MRVPRAPHPPRRTRWDWPLVAVAVIGVIIEAALRTDLAWPVAAAIVGGGAAFTLPVRRTHPLLAVASAFGPIVVLDAAAWLAGVGLPNVHTMIYVVLLVYALVRWGAGREIAIGVPIMLAAALFSLTLDYIGLADAIVGFAFFFAVMALGGWMRTRADSRRQKLEHVRSREREQLARDLHDTVAHHVSAIAIRAQAGIATGATNPRAAIDALRVIETEASRTLTEMRSLIRSLRQDDSIALDPVVSLRELARLESDGTDGPAVRVTVDGDTADLHPSLAATAFRLVQESVTNARRHARRARHIDVLVAIDATSVRVRVSDDGEASGLLGAISPGYGIAGMVERAALLGGTCTAGPSSGRGWTVSAMLPRSGEPT